MVAHQGQCDTRAIRRGVDVDLVGRQQPLQIRNVGGGGRAIVGGEIAPSGEPADRGRLR
jgi:hypothetical protein